MTEKCKKLRPSNPKLALCDDAQLAVNRGYVKQQTLRDMDTGKTRDRLALRQGKESFPMTYCPWCRANIDTST